jgi:hypothetical protein
MHFEIKCPTFPPPEFYTAFRLRQRRRSFAAVKNASFFAPTRRAGDQ